MAYPASPYVEQRNGGLYVAESRVSLDSVVIHFQEGASPERIAQSFSTLKLSQVYGAIAYYLENEDTVKEYLAEVEREFQRSVPPLSQTNPELFARLQAARQKMHSKQT
jgi:uncharacterized protein (DUF433 family)